MKAWTPFALLLVLAVVPATAQQEVKNPDNRASEPGEVALLELEQDVDRTLLREVMLLLGRAEMSHSGDRAQRREAAEVKALEKFVAERKDSFLRRSKELEERRAEATKPATARAGRPARRVETPGEDKERLGLIEKLVEAQVEVQLLQMQAQMYQQPLNEAVKSLAEADFAAGDDPTKQEKADEARKRFEKARARYVDFNKRLQLETTKLGELQMRVGVGGMNMGMGGMGGGGMGGMGGGFR